MSLRLKGIKEADGTPYYDIHPAILNAAESGLLRRVSWLWCETMN